MENADIVLFLFVFLGSLITSSTYIFNESKKAKVVSDREYFKLLFQLIK